MNYVTGSVAYVNDDAKSKNCLLSLFCGEKVVMRTKIVASAAAAGVLFMNVAAAATPAQRSLGQPHAQTAHEVKVMPIVLADNVRATKRPLVAVA